MRAVCNSAIWRARHIKQNEIHGNSGAVTKLSSAQRDLQGQPSRTLTDKLLRRCIFRNTSFSRGAYHVQRNDRVYMRHSEHKTKAVTRNNICKSKRKINSRHSIAILEAALLRIFYSSQRPFPVESCCDARHYGEPCDHSPGVLFECCQCS